MSLLENMFQIFNSDEFGIGDAIFLSQFLKDISMQVLVLLIPL